MDTAHTIIVRFAALAALALVVSIGAHLAAVELAARATPPSVMGPGYNAPPPVIPVS